MKLITLIIPAYNEEKSLPDMLSRLNQLSRATKKYNFEFLFINDGSKDQTAEILASESEKNERLSVLNFSRNFGKEIAVAAGLDYANGDAVVIMDADGQEPPELVPEMIKWWERGFDDVYARRNKNTERGLKGLTSKLYYRTLQKMSRVPIQIDTGDFRLFSKKAVLALRKIRESSRQNKAIFSWIGYKKKEIRFDQQDRQSGQTKWKFGLFSNGNSLINLAIDGFTSFTTIPLRFVTVFGSIVSLVAFIYIIIVIFQTIFSNQAHLSGLPTLLCVTLFLGGVQMVALGIIGEYIGRVFIETKNRPLYLVQDYNPADIVDHQKHEKK
ncbi:MAG: glycosyltransferase family 2 protein [Candidatus Nanoperiomorbaceae bacterium]